MPLYQTVFTNLKSAKLEKQGFGEGNIMNKIALKKILLVLSILFTILTFAGAGYSAVSMLWAVLFTTAYNKVKKNLESE